MTFLIVRVRSDRGVERSIRDTMAMMNLTRVNHATIVPESSTYAGMLQKSKDFVTWGVVDAGTIETLLKERGRMVGDKPVNDAAIKAFIVNRIGDFGLAIAIFLIFFFFGTINFDEVFKITEQFAEKKLIFFMSQNFGLFSFIIQEVFYLRHSI